MLYDGFRKLTAGFYALLSASILALLLVVRPFVHYSYEATFLRPNILLLAFAILPALILTIILWNRRRGMETILKNRSPFIILWGSVILFLLQVTICCNAYFVTGWDAWTVLSQAYRLASNQPMAVTYFSRYPNNLLLLWIDSLIFRACFAFGVTNMIMGTYAILLIQCMLSVLAGWLLYDLCLHSIRSYLISFCGWLCYAVYIGLSPWLLIPYSDSMGLWIPVFLLWLYQRIREKPQTRSLWCVMGAAAAIGYEIKPQAAILTIAVILVELFSAFQGVRQKTKIWSVLKKILLLIVSAAVMQTAGTAFLIPATHMEALDSRRSFGPSHFFMMGLNNESDGGYLQKDVDFSASFHTPVQRKRAEMRVASERLQSDGCVGLLKHLTKKSLINYGDGTFAWGVEGSFYMQLLPVDNPLAQLLRGIFYKGGKYYACFSSVQQSLWLLLLFSSLFSAPVVWKRRKSRTLLTAELSVIGLTAFELLFEARARYLYLYTPIFIFTAVYGWKYFFAFLQNQFSHNDKEEKP